MDPEPYDGEIDVTTLKSRSVSGVVTLISRSFIVHLLSLAGFFFLSVFLNRPDIGLFIAVNDLVSILGYFSDIGLAASLIQKKTTPSTLDLRTTFTLQQILVVTLIIVSLLFSSKIFSYYHIASSGTYLFYALLFSFFLASLKTIPSVVLERKLRFEIFAAVDVVESLLFYGISVILAWRGFGVTSYTWAILARGIVGTAILYKLAPWPIGLSFSVSSLKSLLSFGLPYQINTLMAVVKDRFLNIALWKIIGADGVGIIGWAQTWSQKPLRFVMDNVTKVTFPAFSRLQGDNARLKSGIETSLFFIAGITFPLVALLSVLAPELVQMIPRYSKWQVAIVPLWLYSFNTALASISTPMTNTLNALGKVKINTYLMMMWTVLAWVFTPLLALKYGYSGVAYATAIISLTSFIPVILVRRYIKFSVISSVGIPAIATLFLILSSLSLSQVLPHNLIYLIINGTISTLVFVTVIYLFAGGLIRREVPHLINAFRRR